MTLRLTEKTLLEQMQISDAEIMYRMSLLDLDIEGLVLLASHREIIESNIDEMVDEFYEKQTNIEEISLLIGDADTLMHLRNAQRKYVIDLFSGNYNTEYVNNRLRIGMVHKRIGVEPKLYLSAVRTLKEIIIRYLQRNIDSADTLSLTLDALEKLMYFDITLVFDTYIGSLLGAVENSRKRTELYAMGLESQAKLDPLTGINNQRSMQDLLTRELTVAKRHKTKIALVYMDVDDFKQINDKFGHIKGDEVLKNIGKFLRGNIRESDIPCRYGGDEFCILLPECTSENAEVVCRKIIKEFAAHYPKFTLSFGIAETGPNIFVSSNELIKLADERMYQGKKIEGFQVVY
tara:strand:+ start:27139 stop:28182 length:1044 start_codon:yes stop_codon:yes gene_type:complete